MLCCFSKARTQDSCTQSDSCEARQELKNNQQNNLDGVNTLDKTSSQWLKKQQKRRNSIIPVEKTLQGHNSLANQHTKRDAWNIFKYCRPTRKIPVVHF